MYISVTMLHLKNPFQFFVFANYARKVVNQAHRSPGMKQFKKRGIWLKHYTMTLWEDKEAMDAFSRTGAHLKAMQASAGMAKEIRTYVFEGNALPAWEDGLALLEAKGRVWRANA